MRQLLTTVAATATAALLALPLVSISSTATAAYDYCRRDVISYMKGCSFDTLEECLAARSGIGGDCFRNRMLKDNSNASAYEPKYPASSVPRKLARARDRSAGSRFADVSLPAR
jgi:hypothetical protein